MPTTLTADKAVTATSLVEQFQENTGRHLLDSGDAYGRGFERWQKRGEVADLVAAIAAQPTVTVTKYGIEVATIPHLLSVIEYEPKADKKFRRWVEQDDEANGEHGWLESAERYVSWLLTGDPDNDAHDYGSGWGVGTVNTYNYGGEDLLDETLQYVAFEAPEPTRGLHAGERYVLLQTHNGCDARGGYSHPRVYRYLDSEALIGYVRLTAWHDIEHPQDETLDLDVEPREEEHVFDWYGEWVSREGYGLTGDDVPSIVEEDDDEPYLACPICGAPLSVETTE